MNLSNIINLKNFIKLCKNIQSTNIKVDSEMIYFINYKDVCLYATIYNDSENLICSIWDSVGTYQFIQFKQKDIDNIDEFYNKIDYLILDKIDEYFY